MGNQMWGARFSEGPDALMEAINASIDFDRKLYAQDIEGSKAHATMLGRVGILEAEDVHRIHQGLDTIASEIAAGTFPFSAALEDIHMNIEARLRDLIGEPAGRLHTARSRNDQIATDFKLWVRDALDTLIIQLRRLQEAFLDQAERHASTVMPGFTHLQSAQPVTFGHHLMAYVEMIGRDVDRFVDCRRRLNESPLGAAALAGTSFPIDRDETARALGFDRPAANSLDAVSDRDFALEALAASAITSTHLSRFAEEIVIWCSAQFRFIRLPDRFSTGSSIMPQKRNPDAAELVRGKTGRIAGAFQALLMVMKGLPLTYSKDMQEDKEQTFDALENLSLCVEAMTGMVEGLEAETKAMNAAASSGFSTATDLADWCVRQLGMPFRDAHHVTGRLVAMAEAKGCGLDGLSLSDMQTVEPGMTEDVYSVLSVERSVSSRRSFGGTAPDNVRAAVRRWRQSLKDAKSLADEAET